MDCLFVCFFFWGVGVGEGLGGGDGGGAMVTVVSGRK